MGKIQAGIFSMIITMFRDTTMEPSAHTDNTSEVFVRRRSRLAMTSFAATFGDTSRQFKKVLPWALLVDFIAAAFGIGYLFALFGFFVLALLDFAQGAIVDWKDGTETGDYKFKQRLGAFLTLMVYITGGFVLQTFLEYFPEVTKGYEALRGWAPGGISIGGTLSLLLNAKGVVVFGVALYYFQRLRAKSGLAKRRPIFYRRSSK